MKNVSVPIDLVIPFVDGNDSIWYNEFKKYKNDFKSDSKDGDARTRFDGDDILLYVFRSIQCFVPWINKIHLIVSGPSQVPKWMNTDNVKVVYHKDFIPDFALPCFNSSVFEHFIWNIPGLSEYFIYGNDDLIFNSFVNPGDFFNFDKGDLRNNVIYSKSKIEYLNSAWHTTFVNAAKLGTLGTDVNPVLNGYYLTCEHDFKACSVSNQKDIFTLYENEIRSSFTMFRDEKNINGYLYQIYDFVHNEFKYDSFRNCKYFALTQNNINNIKTALNDVTIKTVCINDIPQTTQRDKDYIKQLLEEKFPIKSIYEL